MVTTESQPLTVCKVVVLVLACVNTTPFHMIGSSLSQTVLESEMLYVGFTVIEKIVLAVHPYSLVMVTEYEVVASGVIVILLSVELLFHR